MLYSWEQNVLEEISPTTKNSMATYFSAQTNRQGYDPIAYGAHPYVRVFFSGSELLRALGITDEGQKNDAVGILTNWFWANNQLLFEFLGVDEDSAPIGGTFRSSSGLLSGLATASSVPASDTVLRNDLLQAIGYTALGTNPSVTFWYLMKESSKIFHQAILADDVYLLGPPCPPFCYG